MREKYNTLKITDLRSIVKGMGIKGTSTMNKDQLVDILVEKTLFSYYNFLVWETTKFHM